MAARRSSPTAEALAKHPLAIVILTANLLKPEIIDFDFEWFDFKSGVVDCLDDYWTSLSKWTSDDFRDNKDAYTLIAEVTDTSTMTLGRVDVIGFKDPNDTYPAEWEAKVKADPTLLLVKGSVKAATAPRVKPKVRPKAPSTAAQAIKGAAKTAPVEDKAEALKAKLAAKRAARKAEAPADEPKAEAAAEAPVMALASWHIPVGRANNGRFARIR